jgi:hypothetical protein
MGMKSYDISLVMKGTTVVVHRPDCRLVRMLADAGEPVATLFGCEMELPPEYERHRCMEEKEGT